MNTEHRGKDLAKFTGRPRLPHMSAQVPNAVYSSVPVEPTTESRRRAEVTAATKPAPSTRTQGTQSDYRENDTQTDPWTSEHVIRPGSAPEVATLSTLTFGAGLPAGLNEVIMIERARSKRAWEKTLPDVEDEASADLRMRMLEEQDAMEWRWREEEIEAIQVERMKAIEAAIARRDDDEVLKANAKMELLVKQGEDVMQDNARKAQHRGLRALRKLIRQRANIEGTLKRRDISRDYANGSSSTYANRAVNGSFTQDLQADNFVVNSEFTSSYMGLLELEATLPESVMAPRVVVPQRNKGLHGGNGHAKARYHSMLDSIDAKLKAKRSRGVVPEPPLRFLERIPPAPKRPPIPEVAVPDEADEQREQAVILMQRLLRGRAEQARMYEGKDRRRDLIAELRTTHALEKAEQETKAALRSTVLKERAVDEQRAHVQRTGESVVGEVAGGNVGRTVDFLGKELIRMQEERRVHAFVMLAEKKRRLREAQEAGKRQREEARRAQQDEIFRQIVGVHQCTVESYLEDILIGAKDSVAAELARTEIRAKAAVIDDLAQRMHDAEEDTTETGAMSIAADLVHSFLLPEVGKTVARTKVKGQQRRFLVAAHQELRTGVDVMESKLTERSRPGSAKDSDKPNSVDGGSKDEGSRPSSGRVGSARAQSGTSRIGSALPKVTELKSDDDALANSAATSIQATYRGHAQRKELKRQEKAAVSIQASYRGHVSRRIGKQEKPADAAVEVSVDEAAAFKDETATESAALDSVLAGETASNDVVPSGGDIIAMDEPVLTREAVSLAEDDKGLDPPPSVEERTSSVEKDVTAGGDGAEGQAVQDDVTVAE